MPYSISSKREFELVGNDLNNDPCIFGRGYGSFAFQQHVALGSKRIAVDPTKYLAFPFVEKVGSSLVGIYSDGDAHASSDRQVMIRSDDNGGTWSSTVFFDVTTPGVYDTSLLTDLLPLNNDSVVLKIWTIKNISGTLTVYQNSLTSSGGNTYAHWSRAVAAPGGKLWRTGYDFDVGGYGETVLLESSDQGATWAYKSTIAPASDNLHYNEASIVNTTGTNWLAIIRENTGSDRRLYKSTSTNDGATWSSPSLLTAAEINGTQPSLIKTTGGLIVLATGDRTGISGHSAQDVWGMDRTGISIFVSDDNGATWGYRTNVSGMTSTDGGQPQMNEISADRLNIVFYQARLPFAKPQISSVSLNVDSI